MANNLLKQINKIKSTISKNDQIVWACQASTKCYTNEISKLEDEERRLTKDIQIINKQIEESKPLVGILEKCSEVQNKTLEISLESLVTERLYKKCLEEKVNKHKRECNLLIGEFSEHLDQCKTKLEHTNPLFKILQEKKIELKKSKIRCLDLQQRLKSLKKKNELRLQIRKQLFHTGIISLAEAWLNQKNILEAQKELQELKQQERKLMMTLMEWTEELRVREKLGNAPRDAIITIPQIQFSKKSTDVDVSNKQKVTPPASPNAGNYDKSSMNPFKDIEALFGENKFGPSLSIEKSSANNAFSNKTDHLPKAKAINCPKVRILENKTLKMSYVPQQVEALRKEEISKAIDAKLQRVTQNFKRSMSRQNSRKVLIDEKIRNANMSNTNTQRSSQEANKEPMDETGKNKTGATQDLENLNILSQETRVAINILSQDSITNSSAETKLKKFKYSSSEDTNKKLVDELSYSEKEIHPQKMDVDNGHLSTEPEESTPQKSEIVHNNLFKMNDGNSFGRNGQFSMNFGGNNFGNPFKNGVTDGSSTSKIFPLPGTKEDLKPLGNTLNFSQPFKMNNRGNNTTDIVFKVPEAAPSNNFLSQSQNSVIASGTSSAPTQLKNSQNLTSHEGNNFFNMHGTQYDFGNTMSQISEIPNDSYELAWSPPAPDLSDNSPMDTNPLFPFGQSNTNFGFSFFK